MGARRCTLCGISYPDEYKFNKCPVHGDPTQFIQADVDEDWEARLGFLVRQRELDEIDSELIPIIEAQVKHKDGLLWVSSHDVIRSGIRYRLPADALIRIGQQVFEIQAYSDSRRAYLVEAFSMTLTDEDLEQLSAPRS